MSLKVKLISSISSFILTLCLLIVGVWTAGTQTINLKGSVNFNIEDSTFYIKDIRINCDDLIGEGSTIENFMPGFVNNSFELNLGTITSTTGSVAVQIDIVNTTGTVYSASSQSNISNATLTVSGTIAGDGVPISEVATYDGVSGTIYINIQATSSTTISLNNIFIELSETTMYKVTINNNRSDIEICFKTDLGSSMYYTIKENDSAEVYVSSNLYLTLASNPFQDEVSTQEENSSSVEPRKIFHSYTVYANGTAIGYLLYVQAPPSPSTASSTNATAIVMPSDEVDYVITAQAVENDEIETSTADDESILTCKITKNVTIDIGEVA